MKGKISLIRIINKGNKKPLLSGNGIFLKIGIKAKEYTDTMIKLWKKLEAIWFILFNKEVSISGLEKYVIGYSYLKNKETNQLPENNVKNINVFLSENVLFIIFLL